MESLLSDFNSQMAEIKPSVQMWMDWMAICFFASVLFVWKHKNARFVLAAFFLTMPVGMFVFYLTGTVHLLGIAHWLVWAPLGYFLYKNEFSRPGFNPKSVYGVWMCLLIATIVICLGFDIWDFSQVAMGNK